MFIFIKILIEGFALALQELWSNKLRSFLSVLGITIGIFCVIAVLMMVDSVERSVKSSFERLGDDVLYVTREDWSEDPGQNWWKYIRRPYPSYREFKALQDKLQTADKVTMRLFVQGKDIKHKSNVIENAILIAATHDFGFVYDTNVEYGRYFSALESNVGKNVILLGSKVAKELFPRIEDPIGKQIKVMGRKVTIIGVLKEEGESLLGSGFDEVAILPYNFVRSFVDVNSKQLMPLIAIKAEENVTLAQLKDEVTGVLRAERKLKPREENNFSLNQMSIITSMLDSVFGVVNFAGFLIGGFSILVGGFGIANIMFVSVKERTGIIGIKKSLGAKNHFILFEFLMESIYLSILGGVLGILLVSGLAFLGNMLISSFTLVLSLENIIWGIMIAAIIGIVAGFIPALSASRMNPVEAIRQNM